MQAKLQHLQRKDEKRQELSRLTTVDFVMFTSSRNDVGDSWRIIIIIIIIIQHLYSAMVSYAGCRGACGAS